MAEEKIKPDWWAVEIDETRNWNLDDKDRPFVEKITGVYFYDRNEHTHCCELTPSYYLRTLGSSIHFKSDTPDAVQERITDALASELYGGDDIYMWVMHVEAIDDKHKHHYGALDDADDCTKEEQEDAVREYYNGNSPF